MSTNNHPEWVAVGKIVQVTRRMGMSVAHRRVVSIERQTAKSVFTADGERFVLKHGRYQLVPKYLDYTTELGTVT